MDDNRLLKPMALEEPALPSTPVMDRRLVVGVKDEEAGSDGEWLKDAHAYSWGEIAGPDPRGPDQPK